MAGDVDCAEWRGMKSLMLDRMSSPITKRVLQYGVGRILLLVEVLTLVTYRPQRAEARHYALAAFNSISSRLADRSSVSRSRSTWRSVCAAVQEIRSRFGAAGRSTGLT